MTELIVTVNIMAPLLLMLLLGWGVRRIGWLTAETTSALNRLIFKLFLPAMLFNNIRSLDASRAPGLSFALYLFFGVLTIFLAAQLIVPRFFHDQRKIGVMVQGIFRTNFALLGVPLMQAVFGDAGNAAVTLAMPVVIPLNNVLAVLALSRCGDARTDVKKLLRTIVTNPLIIASVLGAMFLFTGLPLPGIAESVLKQVGGLASPLSLLVLGASLRYQGVRDNRRELTWTVLLKQVMIPPVMVALAVLLGFRHEELGVVLILFGAPCAVSSYPMAEAMGGDGPLAATQVVLTTICSMATLFVLIYVTKLLALI